jgi:signal transduction histidine kinase
MDSYPGPLAQVLANLMLNAATHGFDEGENGQFTVAVTTSGETVDILCKDNGCGIPPENLAHIFEPFFTTRRGRGGSGLGLHIAHNIVTQVLGGSIHCESTAGLGTTFRMRLPKVVGSEPNGGLHQIYGPSRPTGEIGTAP